MTSRSKASVRNNCLSFDAKQAQPSVILNAAGLRKENSSPAVVQCADISLLKAVVSASGQGAQTVVSTTDKCQKAVWKTRSVRNRTESYAILQLKHQSNRGVTVQVTFLNKASTPKQLRLLHGPAVNGVFKPIEAEVSITSVGADQLQHSLTVAHNTHVQRYLKIEMQGLAMPSSAAGSAHAVTHLDVVQLSALAAAAAATAKQLPLPELSVDTSAAAAASCVLHDELSADVLMRSPSAQPDQDSCRMQVGNDWQQEQQQQTQQQETNGASKLHNVAAREKDALDSATGAEGSCRFNSWLQQTQSTVQKGSLTSIKPAAHNSADKQQKQQNVRQPMQQHQQAAQPKQQQQQSQSLGLQRSMQQMEATLACSRQQLLQLQDQLHRSGSQNQQRQHLPHAHPRVLTTAGRPSTLLCMLRHSSALSETDKVSNSSSTCSIDSMAMGQTCSPSGPSAVANKAVSALAMATPQDTPTAAVPRMYNTGLAGQAPSHQHLRTDDSAVLFGSVNSEHQASSNGSCCGVESVSLGECLHKASQEASDNKRCGSSCSVHGPSSSSAAADQLEHAAHAEEALINAGLQDPELVDSQSCLRPSRHKEPPSVVVDYMQLADRRVQSCPTIDTAIRASTSSSKGNGLRNSSSRRHRLRIASRPASRARKKGASSGRSSGGLNLLRPAAVRPVGDNVAGAGVMLSPEVMRQGQLVKQSCPALNFPRYGNTQSPARGSCEDLSEAVAAAARHGAPATVESSSANELKPDASSSHAISGCASQLSHLKRELFTSPEQQQRQSTAAAATTAEATMQNSQQQQWQQVPSTAALSLSGPAPAAPQAAAGNNELLQTLLFGSSCDFGSISDGQQVLSQALQDSATSGQVGAAAAAAYTAGAGAAGGWSMTYAGLMDSPGDQPAGAAVTAAAPSGEADVFGSLLSNFAGASCSSDPQSPQKTVQQQEQCSDVLSPSGQACVGQFDGDAAASPDDGAGLATEQAHTPQPPASLPRVGGMVLSPIAESPELSKAGTAASPGGVADPASVCSTFKTQSRLSPVQQAKQQHPLDGQQPELLLQGHGTLLDQHAAYVLSSSVTLQQPIASHSAMQQQQLSTELDQQAGQLRQHLQEVQDCATNDSDPEQQHHLLHELAAQPLLEVQASNTVAKASGRCGSIGTPTKQPLASRHRQMHSPGIPSKQLLTSAKNTEQHIASASQHQAASSSASTQQEPPAAAKEALNCSTVAAKQASKLSAQPTATRKPSKAATAPTKAIANTPLTPTGLQSGGDSNTGCTVGKLASAAAAAATNATVSKSSMQSQRQLSAQVKMAGVRKSSGSDRGNTCAAPVQNNGNSSSAVRVSHLKLNPPSTTGMKGAPVAGSGQHLSHNASRVKGLSNTAVLGTSTSPVRPGSGKRAAKYEQLLKTQFGAAPATRTSQSRLSLRASAATSSGISIRTAAYQQQQQECLPESQSEPVLRSSLSLAGAELLSQHLLQLPQCKSEPVVSSLKLADLALEGSADMLADETLYLPAEALAAAAGQQFPVLPQCSSEPSLQSVRPAATAALQQEHLPESQSEPALTSFRLVEAARGLGAQTRLSSPGKSWTAADLHTISTGVRWSQKWSNENSPASSAQASPVKQSRAASSGHTRLSSCSASQQERQLLSDKPAQQLKQAVEAVQALVKHSSKMLEQAGASRQQQQQQPPVSLQQELTPPRELSQQQQLVASAAVMSSCRRQSPGSPDAQTNFFLPKLVQPQLLTPQSAEPVSRQLSRSATGKRVLNAAAGVAGLITTPPGLGMASPKSSTKQQLREQQQQQLQSVQQHDQHWHMQGPHDHAQLQKHHQHGLQDASSAAIPRGSNAAAVAALDHVQACRPSHSAATVAVSSACSPVSKHQLQPQARSCQLVANTSTEAVANAAVTASYKLMQNGAASGERLPLQGQHTAPIPAALEAQGGSHSSPRTHRHANSTIVVSIEKHVHGDQQPPVQLQQTYQFESHRIAEVVQLEAAPGPADSTCTSFSPGGVVAGRAAATAGQELQQLECSSAMQTSSHLPLSASRMAQQRASAEAAVTAAPAQMDMQDSLVISALQECNKAQPQHSAAAAEAEPAAAAAAAADDDDDGDSSSVKSFHTASSQMGTVWPHKSPEHQRRQRASSSAAEGQDLAGCESSSSVSDAGVQHTATAAVAAARATSPQASGVLRLSSDEDDQTAGWQLARNFYQRAANRAPKQPQPTVARPLQQQQQLEQPHGQVVSSHLLGNVAADAPAPAAVKAESRHCSVSTTDSAHSLWDETDPHAAAVSSTADNALCAAAARDSQQQRQEPPHRVKSGIRSSKQSSAGLRTSRRLRDSNAAVRAGSSGTACPPAAAGLFKQASGKGILAVATADMPGDDVSDIDISQNEASSAYSGVGPVKQPGAAVAAQRSLTGEEAEDGEVSSQAVEVQRQYQNGQPTGSSLSFAAMDKHQRSPSPSTAAMAEAHVPVSSSPVMTGPAAGPASVQGVRSIAAVTTPAASAALTTNDAASVDSSCASASGTGADAFTFEVSLNDLGVWEQQKAAGGSRCSKDQSPNKSPVKDVSSPTRLRSSKAGMAVVSPLAGVVPDQADYEQGHDDVNSVLSSQESYAGMRTVKQKSAAALPPNASDTAKDAASSKSSGAYQHRETAKAAAAAVVTVPVSPLRNKLQQKHQQLQVVVPSSPQLASKRGSTVNFSPLHAARSTAARSSWNVSGGTPSKAVGGAGVLAAAFSQQASSAGSHVAVVQPAFYGSNATEADPATAVELPNQQSGHLDRGVAAASGVAAAGASATRSSAGGGASPYSCFAPLHSMLPGSGSGRRSSKTQTRIRQDTAAGCAEDEVVGIKKNLMADMLMAAEGQAVPVRYAAAATGANAEPPDTHGVRDSSQRSGTASGHAHQVEESTSSSAKSTQHMQVHKSRPHTAGSVLEAKLPKYMPTIGVSPELHRQRPATSQGTAGSTAIPLSGKTSKQQGNRLLQEQQLRRGSDTGSNCTPEATSHRPMIVPRLDLAGAGLTSQVLHNDAAVADSIQLMSHSSAALRAAAATPAPIPNRPSSTPEQKCMAADGVRTSQQHSSMPPQHKQPQRQQSSGLKQAQGAAAAEATRSSISGTMNKKVSSSKPKTPAATASATPPTADLGSGSGAGPLSSGLLRRGNSASSLPHMFAAPGGTARPQSPSVSCDEHVAAATTAASSQSGAARQALHQHKRPHSPASSALTGPSSASSAMSQQQPQQQQAQLILVAEGGRQNSITQQRDVAAAKGASTRLQPQPEAAKRGDRLRSSYLQQLADHNAQQNPLQQQPVPSPLSSHRHNLQLKGLQQQQQSMPTNPVLDASPHQPGTSLQPQHNSGRQPDSCTGPQPGTSAVGSGSHASDLADAVSSPLLSATRRFSSTGGGGGAAADGVSPARMGKLRHRRTKSDMPELYQPLLSPLESPLHTAMPEDDETAGLTMPTATAATGMPEPVVAAGDRRLAARPSAVAVGFGPSDPPTSPLGSPLRHGLTSPAALYRLQQQQLQREASAPSALYTRQQQLEAERTAALAASPGFEFSEPELTLKPQHEGVVRAIADAVAGYEGSMSPRRLARIQEYISGLASVDLGAALSPPAFKANAGGTPGKESDAMDSFNLNNQLNFQAELEQQQQHLPQEQDRQHLWQQQQPPPPAFSVEPSKGSLTSQAASQASAEALLPAAHVPASNTSKSQPSGCFETETAVVQPSHQRSRQIALEQQQPSHAASGSSSHSRQVSRRSESAASRHNCQEQQATQQDTAAAVVHYAGSSTSSSAPSNSAEVLLQAIAAAGAAAGIDRNTLLASVHDLLDMPALLAASAETLDIQPGESGQLSWQGSRLSTDSQQEAVMQSQGALLGPGPGFCNSQGQLQDAEHAREDGDHVPGLPGIAHAGPATASGMLRRSAHVLAGLAHGLWQPQGSIESTAGSNAVGRMSRGMSHGAGVRCSTGSLNPEMQLAHHMATSVEHLAASLDITGPQALQLTQEYLFNELLGRNQCAQAGGQPLTCTTSAAGTAGQQSSRQGAESSQQQQEQQRRPVRQTGQGRQQEQQDQHLGPLLRGRLAALANMRQLRRSSVGESPDVADSRSSLPRNTNSSSSSRPASALGNSASGVARAGGVRGSRCLSAAGSSRGNTALGKGGILSSRACSAKLADNRQVALRPSSAALNQQNQQQQLQEPAGQRQGYLLDREGSGNVGFAAGSNSESRSRRSSGSGSKGY